MQSEDTNITFISQPIENTNRSLLPIEITNRSLLQLMNAPQDATETGNELSQPKFEFTSLMLNSANEPK